MIGTTGITDYVDGSGIFDYDYYGNGYLGSGRFGNDDSSWSTNIGGEYDDLQLCDARWHSLQLVGATDNFARSSGGPGYIGLQLGIREAAAILYFRLAHNTNGCNNADSLARVAGTNSLNSGLQRASISISAATQQLSQCTKISQCKDVGVHDKWWPNSNITDVKNSGRTNACVVSGGRSTITNACWMYDSWWPNSSTMDVLNSNWPNACGRDDNAEHEMRMRQSQPETARPEGDLKYSSSRPPASLIAERDDLMGELESEGTYDH